MLSLSAISHILWSVCQQLSGRFCHLDHSEHVPRLDKKQRGLLQGLNAGERLKLVGASLRAKVAELGLEEQAFELLEILETERADHQLLASLPTRSPLLPGIRKVLGQMNIICLTGVACYGERDEDGAEFREKVKRAVEKLRCQLQEWH